MAVNLDSRQLKRVDVKIKTHSNNKQLSHV